MEEIDLEERRITIKEGLSAEEGYQLFLKMEEEYQKLICDRKTTHDMDKKICVVLDFSAIEMYSTAFLYNSIGKFVLFYGSNEFKECFCLSDDTNCEIYTKILQVMKFTMEVRNKYEEIDRS